MNWEEQIRSSTNQSQQMTRGRLVEEIVALLHDRPEYTIDRNVRFPSRRNPKRPREIDILASTSFLGHPIYLAFECKNYAKRVGIEKIGEFADKLEDVGIPVQYGIFIATNGYTKGAIDRAQDLGIRLLLLDGLTQDRLAVELHNATQSIVYLLLDVLSIRIVNQAAEVFAFEQLFLRDQSGKVVGSIMDLIWADWRDGKISTELDEHEIAIPIPANWQWIIDGVSMPSTASATIKVTGVVVTRPGKTQDLQLRDASTGITDRRHIHTSYASDQLTLPVTLAETEEELQVALELPAFTRLSVGRIPLPRIRHIIYWPPSHRIMLELKRQFDRTILQGQWPFDELVWPAIGTLEGTDLATVWEPISPMHPASQNNAWPWLARQPRRISRPSVLNRKRKRNHRLPR